jgi:ADP-ribose pyrophosphatase
MEYLISVCTTVAFCNEKIPVYVAFVKGEAGDQDLDEDEVVNTKAFTVDELCEKIYSGAINDSKTIAAVLAYKDKYLHR